MNALLIYPLFAMFLLSFLILVILFLKRVRAVRSGKVRMSYFKVLQNGEVPEDIQQATRHFTNLFEAPVLFYVVCILGILFSEGLLFTALAWVYVVARILHAWIHMGSNNIIHRMYAYGLGWTCLLGMWGLLLFHQLFPVKI